MTDIIVCAITNLFRIYLISRFIHTFLDGYKNAHYGKHIIHMVAYGGFFIINTATYLVFHRVWMNVAGSLLGMLLIVLTYTRSVKMILFVVCSVYIIDTGCETIAILPFVNYQDGVGFNQIYEVIHIFLLLICEVVTERIVSVRHKTQNIRNIPLVLVPICGIVMICVMFYTKSGTKTGFVTVSIGLILMNFFIFYLYNMLSEALSHQYENEMLRQEIQGYANQLNIMLQSEEKVNALKHDMKHHMNELKILAAKGDNIAIEKYIGDMEDFIKNSNEFVYSGNLEIDSVMNYMLRRAKEELCTVNVKVHLPESVNHSFDINVILGNLLENSIEAARQTEEKRLDVNIELKQGVLRVQVENSYQGKLEKRHQKLLTTKSEKGFHGIGLTNVRKIVEKYNGIMDIYTENNIFGVMLVLYM
ncbi:MAG: GHKL domain-containing protein [Lachnoclostridium sp.]|nr:GHKL domain-containing protein [Lachnospira sp.]MCM1248041.1 GHKL domain-containing protein [Lachnoclostridium sp.]